jgi:hypothetical protein
MLVHLADDVTDADTIASVMCRHRPTWMRVVAVDDAVYELEHPYFDGRVLSGLVDGRRWLGGFRTLKSLEI